MEKRGRKKKVYDPKFLSDLLELFDTKTTADLAKMYHCSNSTITRMIRLARQQKAETEQAAKEAGITNET